MITVCIRAVAADEAGHKCAMAMWIGRGITIVKGIKAGDRLAVRPVKALRDTGVDDGDRHTLARNSLRPDSVGAYHFRKISSGPARVIARCLDSSVDVHSAHATITLQRRQPACGNCRGNGVDNRQLLVGIATVMSDEGRGARGAIGRNDHRLLWRNGDCACQENQQSQRE